LGREIVYCRFPLMDGGGNSPVVLRAAVEITVRFAKENVPTLVACGAGMSRSPAVVTMALAKIDGRSPDECLAALVAGQPHDVSPLFWDDLQRALA
jgi:protein-tyrosine phosphatase